MSSDGEEEAEEIEEMEEEREGRMFAVVVGVVYGTLLLVSGCCIIVSLALM